jgi:coenzyme F420 hydrogenase subunit beta
LFQLRRKSFKTVSDVVDWRLCLGCGACAFICPEQKIDLVDIVQEGIRPILANTDCTGCSACLQVCPAFENDCTGWLPRTGIDAELARAFGPVMETWEGYALDQDLRHYGASGGIMTALALYCLEREQMHGVLHIGGDPADPVRNSTRMSRSRADLLSCTGSRYAPASACDKLNLVETAPAPCVFIGQPSEVAALRKVERLKPTVREKVGVTISFFCAGSPATQGTIDLLESAGLNLEELEEIRYRGMGWPGKFAVRRKGATAFEPLMTYKQSWGFLQKYRPYAIYLNPDNSGEYADISCADPWYRGVREHPEGFSLVVVRTETGRRIVRGAIEAGYIHLQPVDTKLVIDSQKGFVVKRGAIWGRIATMAAFGLPVPRLRGFGLFSSWLELSFKDKCKSIFGTARRILQRGYRTPQRLSREALPAKQTALDRAKVTKDVKGEEGLAARPFAQK